MSLNCLIILACSDMKTGKNELDYRSQELCQNQYTSDSLKMKLFCTRNLKKKKAKKTPKKPKKQQNLGRKRKKQINKKETQRNKARKDTLFNSQVLSILCLLESVRSVGSHCLLRIGPLFKKFCSYLSYLTVTEMYPYALQLNLCNCGRNSCACILILAITIKPFILCT